MRTFASNKSPGRDQAKKPAASGVAKLRQSHPVQAVIKSAANTRHKERRFEKQADQHADHIAGKEAGFANRQAMVSRAGGTTASETMSSGRGLDAESRSYFENRLKTSLSGVKIHTGHTAASMNRQLGSHAFTRGNDIYFSEGKYRPASKAGKWLLAHELSHTRQPGAADNVRMYRPATAFNFGKLDTDTLKEDSFVKGDKDSKPWLKTISVNLSSTKTDDNGLTIQSGSLTAQYYPNAVKLGDITADSTGGSKEHGRTDKVSKTVFRMEGVGYNSGKYSGSYDKANREGPSNRYSKDLSSNMHYAIFYNGGEALHIGDLGLSSHGCVHIAGWDVMRQLNYHTVIGRTKVTVT